MELKKVLFITCENPLSKDNGDRIYTANFLEALSDLKYNIDLVCYDDNKSFEKSDTKIVGYNNINIFYVKLKRASKLKVMFSLLPGSVVNRKSISFSNQLESMLDVTEYDFIFVNHQRMVFSLEIILNKNVKSKTCFISHNVESLLSKNNALNCKSIIDKGIYLQDSFKSKLFEDKWLNYFDYITTISEYDQDYFMMNFNAPKISVIRPVIVVEDSDNNKKLNNTIIVGSFMWKPKRENLISFLNSKTFKRLFQNDIHLIIVGRADSKLVDMVNNNFEGVFMTGEVDSVNPYYSGAKIAIIPEILGGGFKLKVAESALHKTAIFAVKGAITNCNLKRNKNFVEASDFEELISKIIEYQKRDVEIDLMIEETYKIANVDFSKEKFKSDLNTILN